MFRDRTSGLSSGLQWLSLLFVVLAGCERFVPPVQETEEIPGFGIKGIVRNDFGQPLPDVEILVGYDLQFVSTGPEPSRSCIVPFPGGTVAAEAYDGQNRFVRLISTEVVPAGEYTVLWDMKDQKGNEAPAGLYEVRYAFHGLSLGKYTVLVNGTVTAHSDSNGVFVIPEDNLPIGSYPVPVYSGGGTLYRGNYRIGEEVFLELRTASRVVVVSVVVSRGSLTPLDIRVN